MGYDELVDINDALKHQPDLQALASQRAPAIQRLTDDFILFYENRFGITVSAIEEVAQKLSGLYFTFCYQQIKPVIHDKTNRYKMASLMELIIVQEQVLSHPESDGNELLNRELNAKFAMTAAFSMVKCMIHDATEDLYFSTDNSGVNDRVHKVLRDHEVWLKTKTRTEMPVFINAQFHELIEILLRAPYQIHG